jgi:16S rRNA (adenine1518-N6/adenine1519-N6)-dimethyltransferase
MDTSPAPRKSLGQHWLHDYETLQAICLSADLQPSDTVLEIGPGLGTLTELLVHEVDQVMAVEFDKKLADELPTRVPEDNLKVVQQDILSFDFTSLPTDYKVVANIPYYLTSNLIRVMSETPNAPSRAVILIQKEVAERVAAEPGQMSLLSATAQFYWQVSLGIEVPARLFTPPPKVDSQVVILEQRGQPLFTDVDTKDFFRVIKAGFAQKRKTLLNSLSSGLHVPKDLVVEACEKVGIEPIRRAQTLSLDEWHDLYHALNT